VALGTNPICVAAPSQQEGDDFLLDMATCVMGIRKIDAELPVLVPRDPERAHAAKVQTDGGITYHINLVNDLWRLSQVLGVKPLQCT
ncbi:putative Malate dehydrogenase-like 3, partial [Homarus americanus]